MTSDTELREVIARNRDYLDGAIPERQLFAIGHEDLTALLAAAERALVLEAENFALAANQCHDGYAGEHGHHMCREVQSARKIADAYEELRATVRGECPSLLNEDSGGSAVLIQLDIEALEAIRALKEPT